MSNLVFVPLDKNGRHVISHKEEEIENVSLRDLPKDKLLKHVRSSNNRTVNSDLLYATLTQPREVELNVHSDKQYPYKYTKSRLLNILFNLLVYEPDNVTNLFTIAVRPPSSVVVERFAKDWCKLINQKLMVSEEIEQEVIDEYKKLAYKQGNYKVPLEVIEAQLDEHQPYITYLMDTEGKHIITQEEYDEVSAIAEGLRRRLENAFSLRSWTPSILTGEYVGSISKMWMAQPVPAFNEGKHEETVQARFALLIEGFIEKIGLPMLNPSFYSLDIGLAALLYDLVKEEKRKLTVMLDVADYFGNMATITISPKSLDNLKSITKNAIERLEKGPLRGRGTLPALQATKGNDIII